MAGIPSRPIRSSTGALSAGERRALEAHNEAVALKRAKSGVGVVVGVAFIIATVGVISSLTAVLGAFGRLWPTLLTIAALSAFLPLQFWWKYRPLELSDELRAQLPEIEEEEEEVGVTPPASSSPS